MQRYETVIASVPAVVYTAEIDPDGSWMFASEGTRVILEISPDDVVEGRESWFERVHPDDRNRVLVHRLAAAAEFRDDETAAHVRRMSLYSELIGRQLGMDAQQTNLLRIASAMHDVGKIGVPDAILRKPGRLSADEIRVIQRHPEIGHAILAGSGSELLDQAAEIALTHHERYDGTGYPRHLSGAEIPLVGRIAAVADVFDALSSDRVYRPAFELTRAVEMMRSERGTHFDPDVLDAFNSCLDQLFAIHDQTPGD